MKPSTFSPPGTGKTLIAKAYQQEARGMKFINVLPADIYNCYIGEGEKSLDALFRVAKRNSPMIIFFGKTETSLREVNHGDGFR